MLLDGVHLLVPEGGSGLVCEIHGAVRIA